MLYRIQRETLKSISNETFKSIKKRISNESLLSTVFGVGWLVVG